MNFVYSTRNTALLLVWNLDTEQAISLISSFFPISELTLVIYT